MDWAVHEQKLEPIGNNSYSECNLEKVVVKGEDCRDAS